MIFFGRVLEGTRTPILIDVRHGSITFEVAKLAAYDNTAKRKEAIARLYAQARKLFTEEQFRKAVEDGWAHIAKPKLEEVFTK